MIVINDIKSDRLSHNKLFLKEIIVKMENYAGCQRPLEKAVYVSNTNFERGFLFDAIDEFDEAAPVVPTLVSVILADFS
jgi:hypothetical protein